jgi:DNA (cytosine-5)-methyltransferase 1
MRRRKILVADLLCGAGGSSTGCQRALSELGLEMELVCVNHWDVAIETHKKNHPEARHYCQDIASVRPHLVVPEGYLDLLMASPTCTHHSVARGGKPTSDQQRSDPWHIVTWFTELRVKRAIIENVWEFVGWGPVDVRTGKPIKSRKGEYFRAWVDTIWRLGATSIEYRKLNAADYGDATTRSRFIMMIRFDGKPIVWPQPTHFKRDDGKLALFPGMKPWKPARDIIDWNIKGKSIFARKKPLAPKTLARIYSGAVKFGWPEPFLVILRNHMAGQSVDAPLPTIAANGTHIGLAQPVIMNGRRNNQAKPVTTEPVPSLDTKGGVWLAEPFVLSRHAEGAPRSVDEPTPTQVAKQSHVLVTSYYGASQTAGSAEEPLPTVTTKDRFGIVVPLTHAGGHDRALNTESDPLPTVTGANRGELAVITAQHGERPGQAPRVHSVDAPVPTIAASGHVDLAQGVVTPVVDGDSSGDPSRTALVDGSRQHYDILFRMLEPHELAAAMGFTDEEAAYEFAGTKTEQIKQIGNAVSVSKMKACVGAIMADAAPKAAAKSYREPRRASA